MLIDAENATALKREKRIATRAAKEAYLESIGEVEMKKERKQKFNRGRILPRREYKAKRRQEKLARNAAPCEHSKSVVSKKMRIVKDKSSIRK